jgi:cytochrome P450
MMTCGRAPGGWPIVGHVAALRRRPLEFLDSLPAHGDLVEIRLGPRPAYVICHPDLARQVLTDFRTFDRAGPIYDRVRAAMGSGLATVSHSGHRRQRLIMQPAFRHAYLPGYAPVMREEIAAMLGKWRDGETVDMVEEMFTLTTTVVLRTLFSSQISAQTAGELRTVFDVFLRGVYTRAALPLAGGLPTRSNRRYAKSLARWRAQVRDLIDGYRQAGTAQDDLMSRLLGAGDDQQQGMTDEELFDQVAVLLLAGGETTSAAVVWSLHLVTENPDVLAALRLETDSVIGGDVASWNHLPRLDLTARVLQEALRLYPPAWVLPRTCVRETRLAGKTLPAGTVVLFSPYILHRRPAAYHQPHRFDPGRWRAPIEDSAAPRPASFLPFGAGATKCIGEEFGVAEATLAVASIAGQWDLSVEAGRTVSPAARAVLAPKTFRVRLSRRSAG